MERAHQLTQAAHIALVAILVGLAACAVGAAIVTKNAAQSAAFAVHQSAVVEDALYQMEVEESLERQYELAPSERIRVLHADAERLQQDDYFQLDSLPGLAHILDLDKRYDTASDRVFNAVDAHQTIGAAMIRAGDVAYDNMQRAMHGRAAWSRTRAADGLLALHDTEDAVLALTTLASLAGLLLLSVVMLVLRHSKRLAAAAALLELNRFKTASRTDHLTGLGNHRAYQDDVAAAVAECRLRGAVLTVALVDVDELKVVNDRRGHVSGDQILAVVADALLAAGPACYRLGGDEFAVAFAGVASTTVKQTMEVVREEVAAQHGGTTISIGIATTSRDAQDVLVVREQADAALYEAKRRGRNTVVTFDEIRNDHPVFLPARVEEVRQLIATGAMGVAFQPIWSMDTRGIIGYEALARPRGENPINPQDAFDIAERIGKAHDLDRVCRNATLKEAASLPPGAQLFLNVSPQSLDHDALRGDELVRAVRAVGLTPERVVLEITERSLARIDIVIREALRLRRLGFRLALDDAGSGNAGLEMLSKLEVDYVKIDREVIVRAQAGKAGRGVLAGILAIAHEMEAGVIAEGIEDAAMLDFVRRATRATPMECAVQGYYLGVPREGFVAPLEAAAVAPRLAGSLVLAHSAQDKVAS